MDAEELLRKAWQAVEKSGIPDPHRGLALKEAVDFLRSSNRSASDRAAAPQSGAAKTSSGQGQPRRDAAGGEAGIADPQDQAEQFFSQLSSESGMEEDDLTDILNLTADGKVQVVVPTRRLGSTTADQARTIISLVAGARSKGLGESPVKADAIREELQRKQCYQSNNFAVYHLGPLKGFNAGANRSEILVNSKWLDEFRAAVARAHGRASEGTAE